MRTLRAIPIVLFLAMLSGGIAHAGTPKVLIKTNMGDIQIELNREKAPITVNNFLKYVKSGFYNGTIFHRVITKFMIQGGGLTPDMETKETLYPPIKNESKNGLKNKAYTIAMARRGEPHSATSQFFINAVDNDFLNPPSRYDWGYCVFGKVIAGTDVVDRIQGVATADRAGYSDVPVEPVIVESITVY